MPDRSSGRKKKKHTLLLHVSFLPTSPWIEVSIDFSDLPNENETKHVLVVIDDCPHYPEVEMVSTTSINIVIPKLDKILSAYDIPAVTKTDNGSSFQGSRFTKFAEYLSFKHCKLSLHWPQANGTLKKELQNAAADGLDVKNELFLFLSN